MSQVARRRTNPPRNARRKVVFVARVGQYGGLDDIQIADAVQPGVTVRRNVHTQVNSIAAPPPFGWVDNPPVVTSPLRYRATTRFRRVGTDRSINAAARPIVPRKIQQSIITRQAGNAPSRPTVRNRLMSFGSRVPTLNAPSPNATGPA